MADDAGTTDSTTDAGATDAAAATTATDAGAATGTATEPQDVASLPDWAQRIIRETRAEAANHRTKATTAAQDAEKAFADRIAVAAGLKPETAADPAALTAKLTASEQEKRDAKIQLAVFKAAGKAQANPDALLDSNTFLANVNGLDPTSSDFPTQVADAIKAAVTQNPLLKLAQAAGASAADHAGGSGEVGQITEAQLAGATAEQIDTWHRAGRLDHLLN